MKVTPVKNYDEPNYPNLDSMVNNAKATKPSAKKALACAIAVISAMGMTACGEVATGGDVVEQTTTAETTIHDAPTAGLVAESTQTEQTTKTTTQTVRTSKKVTKPSATTNKAEESVSVTSVPLITENPSDIGEAPYLAGDIAYTVGGIPRTTDSETANNN